MGVLLKVVQRIINNPKAVSFNDVKRLLEFFGYEEEAVTTFLGKWAFRMFVFQKRSLLMFIMLKK